VAVTEAGSEDGLLPRGPSSFASHPSAILTSIATATSSAFIGRAEELGRLSELLDRAEQGRRAVALIGGDAGVGKTRLLAEVVGQAEGRGMRVLVGGCMEAGDLGLPYVPFIDAFRQLGHPEDVELLASMTAAVPNLGRLLPNAGDERPSSTLARDEFDQVELFGGVLSLLERLSEAAPLLLVIEDLHWADRSTRDLLAFVVRALRTGRIGVIASYRADELHRRHPLRPLLAELVRTPDVARIDLAPFTREELAQHLESLVGERVESSAIDRILDRSEGNVFFAEELLAAGAIRTDVRLPEALADVLRTRIEALSETAQEVLKVASIAGRRVSHDLLVAACGCTETELETSLHEAIAGQVLVADPTEATYRFRHALLQEAVYGDLLPSERTRLHATYAELLAASGPAAELAHHSLAAHDLPGALSALITAATEATSVSAPAEALGHLTQALEIWERVPDAAAVAGVERPTVLLRAAAAAGNSGEFKRAVDLAREAVTSIDATKNPEDAARANERLGEHLYQASIEFEEMLAAFRTAVELVPPEPPSALRVRVTGGLARALAGASRYEEARRWCDEALSVAKEVEAPEDETHALTTLAILEARADNGDGARKLLQEARAQALATGSRAQELRAQYSLGALELDIADLRAACTALDEAIALADRYGLRWSQYGINSRALRSFAYYAAGEWDEAQRISASLEDHLSEAYAGAPSAAALFVEIGRGLEAAKERLALLEPLSTGDDWVGYLAGGCGVDLALWEGDLERARAGVQRTLSVLDSDEVWELAGIWPAALGIAAEAEAVEQARIGSNDDAIAEASKRGETLIAQCRGARDRAREVGRQIGPEALAWLARAEAEYSRVQGKSDVELWTAAADAFSYGYVYEEARSRWRLAEALLGADRRDEANEQARLAYEVAVRLNAAPLRAAIEALARRGRLDIGAAAPARTGAEGLTERELEVLQLVAEGRSNQQIADALFISRKTASVHVSHILAKLGASTRVEAAAIAHRLGLDGAGQAGAQPKV
jgi:predicted ATPase/DNA-binding CsgD family transcriptional regulator